MQGLGNPLLRLVALPLQMNQRLTERDIRLPGHDDLNGLS
jgi:hypothetical protein